MNLKVTGSWADFILAVGIWVGMLIFAVWFAIPWAKFVHASIARWPEIVYEWRKPSTLGECSQIRPGMELPQVLGAINSKAEPFEEKLEGNRFTFWRRSHACVVDIEPVSGRVVKAHVEKSPMHSFLPSQQ